MSSAMNVGHPSNLARLVALYGGVMDEQGVISRMPDMEAMRSEIHAVSVSEPETKATIKEAWDTYQLLLEPHGSVGWRGLHHYLEHEGKDSGDDRLYVSLETAHPAKFPEQIQEILSFDPEQPESLKGLEDLAEQFDTLPNDYPSFKDYLNHNY
jgi:threonine synthase